VEPIVQHTVQPVLEHEIKPVKKLKTFVKKNIPIKLPKQHVSDTSKTLLGGIVNQMELAVNSWKLNQTYRERILNPDEFPKGGDFDHIVEDVKKEILSYKHHLGKQYSLVWVSTRIKIVEYLISFRWVLSTLIPFSLK
jgi:hypothetical protein